MKAMTSQTPKPKANQHENEIEQLDEDHAIAHGVSTERAIRRSHTLGMVREKLDFLVETVVSSYLSIHHPCPLLSAKKCANIRYTG